MSHQSAGSQYNITKQALFKATPPTKAAEPRGTQWLIHGTANLCVVCHKSCSAKNNPLQLPSQSTWDSLSEKVKQWQEFDSPYSELHNIIKVGETPQKVHKLCKLDVSVTKLTRAKQAKDKQAASSAAMNEDTQSAAQVSHSPLKRKRCRPTGKSNLMCIFCLKPLLGKVRRSRSGSRIPVRYHRIETQDSWGTFVKAVEYVEDRTKKAVWKPLLHSAKAKVVWLQHLTFVITRTVGKNIADRCGARPRSVDMISLTGNA